MKNNVRNQYFGYSSPPGAHEGLEPSVLKLKEDA